jgi:hypothetical protein
MQNFVEIYQLVLEIQHADGCPSICMLKNYPCCNIFFLTILLSARSEVIVYFQKVVSVLN